MRARQVFPASLLIDCRSERSDEERRLGKVMPDAWTPEGKVEIDLSEPHYLLPVTCDHRYQRILLVSLVLRKLQTVPPKYERVGLTDTECNGTWDELICGIEESDTLIL